MRPIMKITLCAFVAAGVAAPAVTASSDYFLKLGDIKGESAKGSERHKDQIEILSWSWGEARSADALTDGLLIIRNANQPPPAKKGGNVEYAWKVEAGEKAPPPPGGVRVAAGDVNGDGRADIVSPRDAASGMPTGKRQHGWNTVSKPLDRGAVRVKVRFPWLDCRVGARYPSLSLGGANNRYELRDAIITSCGSASSGGESLPMEEISFNYAKIQVRGWDPAKKEE